jgi:hypothetical protein
MELLTWGNVWWVVWGISVSYGAIKAIQALKGTVSTGFTWNRTRKLARLRKRREHLIQLHDSDREYHGWLLSGVLWVLALFAVALLFEGVSVRDPLVRSFVLNLGRYLVGLTAFMVALARLSDYRSLQHFDRTIAFLDRRIATLEAKTALQPAPAGV